jgi:hypothetical protein
VYILRQTFSRLAAGYGDSLAMKPTLLLLQPQATCTVGT